MVIENKKIVLFGSTGNLGKELVKLYEFITPSHDEVDITNFDKIKEYLENINPSIVINSVALVGIRECNENKEKAYKTNIIGTFNLAKICQEKNIKLIQISTDMIFEGNEKGDYKEEDLPNPVSFYSISKFAGECFIQMIPSSLIIRTSFFPKIFKYDKAFVDQKTTRMPVDKLAAEVILAIEKNLTGVIHIAGEKDSLYNIVKKTNPDIGKITRAEIDLKIPRDLSLNTDKWKNLKKIYPFKVNMPESVKEPLLKTIFSGYVGQGERVNEFEKEFSKKFKIKNVVSVNSGTSALKLALDLIGVGPGDEVITTPYTWVGTNTVILEQFAKPVFADVQYDTGNIDPHDIEKRINNKTKAIIVVHFGGYPCDMDEISKIAKKHNLPIIEDAAHALGAEYKGKPIGTISDYTIFSFQAIKHITTGDGGMISVLDDDKYKQALRKRWFGIDRMNKKNTFSEDPFGDIKEKGFKHHMNDIAATIGLEQLKHFDSIFERRKEIAEKYKRELRNIPGIKLLKYENDRIHANWLFVVHIDNRNDFMEHMNSKGIITTIHNWRNDKYSIFGGIKKDLPNLEKLNKTLVNLPFHYGLSNYEIDYIIQEIKNYFNKYFETNKK